jgi:hypothetical protein
VVVSLNGGEE